MSANDNVGSESRDGSGKVRHQVSKHGKDSNHGGDGSVAAQGESNQINGPSEDGKNGADGDGSVAAQGESNQINGPSEDGKNG